MDPFWVQKEESTQVLIRERQPATFAAQAAKLYVAQ
jgi:hypothetical protein